MLYVDIGKSFNSQPSVLASIQKTADENDLSLVDEVEQAIERIRNLPVPPKFDLQEFKDGGGDKALDELFDATKPTKKPKGKQEAPAKRPWNSKR